MYNEKDIEMMLRDWGDAWKICSVRQEEIKKFKMLNGNSEHSSDINELIDAKNGIINRKIRIDKYIQRLPNEYQIFLYLRYVKKYQYVLIALNLNRSRSGTFRLRKMIFEKLISLMNVRG